MALMSLKIPSGFAICYNSFEDIEPGSVDQDGLLVNGEYFKEDLLQIQRMELHKGKWRIPGTKNLIIDLGWYPDSDPQGHYKLVLVDENWNELYIKEVSDRFEIKNALEELMEEVNQGKF